jgi:demethylmenaquinone methyltransferase/2-methoxy-6-polyprenyl-1,4-benzoquinol methylase
MQAAEHPISKDSSRIAGMFDAIAGRYDLLNHLLSAGLDRQWRRRAVEVLDLTGRERVLDLCTGTADLALAAMEGAKRARQVIGIDFSSAMLQIGREKTREFPSIRLIRGDATRIPMGDGVVDAVTIGFGIRNVEEPVTACREIARVLLPVGKLVILEFSLPKSAIIRNAYRFYFRRLLPLVGRLISRHPSAYTYLPQSVEVFPSPEEFAQVLRVAGFSRVRVVPLSLGIVYMFVAEK